MRFDEDLMKILPSSTALNNTIKNLVSAGNQVFISLIK
jgi:hypothetical protein